MKKTNTPLIRELLREHPDGLTVRQITDILGARHHASIHASIATMPDAYIDRWTKMRDSRGRYSAIWCVVTPPENCPHPERPDTFGLSHKQLRDSVMETVHG